MLAFDRQLGKFIHMMKSKCQGVVTQVQIISTSHISLNNGQTLTLFIFQIVDKETVSQQMAQERARNSYNPAWGCISEISRALHW